MSIWSSATSSHRYSPSLANAPAASAMLLAASLGSASALAQVPTITDARVEAGRLVVTGSTPAPVTLVRLDKRFTIRSNGVGAFTFVRADYLPSDCIVEVALVGASDPPPTAVVANCGVGFTSRGNWASAARYLANDLVTFDGSTWRARRESIGASPPASPADWALFASKGAVGTAGLQGPAGATGATGPAGPAGPQGAAGAQGPQGDPGATGPQGPGVTARGPWSNAVAYATNDLATHAGSTWRALAASTNQPPDTSPAAWELFAAKGATGDVGPEGATGPTGPAGPQGPQGIAGTTGATGPAGPAGPQGVTGPEGPAGPQGVAGPGGPQGPAGSLAPVVAWSGGCSNLVQPNGDIRTFVYCLDYSEFNHSSDYFTVASGGVITFQTAGLYRFEFSTLARGCQAYYVTFFINDASRSNILIMPASYWEMLWNRMIWPIAAGDTAYLRIPCDGAVAPDAIVHHSAPQGWGKLQIQHLGTISP